MNAAQNFDQRRLAGAVFADDRVHFARHDIEIDAVEDAIADKRLADAARGKQRHRSPWLIGAG
jgi:hypothetical protein